MSEDLDRRVVRVLDYLEQKPSDLERYNYLIELSDRNQTLFFMVVMSDPMRFVPILYHQPLQKRTGSSAN